jgi:hypothetical protein
LADTGSDRECNATSTTAATARTLLRDNKFMQTSSGASAAR